MNDDDHAIVIGIRRYADAIDPSGWITNLNGPDNDADAIADWLRDPAGGALPPDNVTVVRSADFPDPFAVGAAGPAQQAIVDALDSVMALPTDAYDDQYAGRRFYLYVSGHGCAAERYDGALLTAEATHATRLNVLATDWMEWLWYANRFRELVLWVDACATRTPVDMLTRCKVRRQYHQQPDARRFDAFAAQFNLMSVENEMPDGQWHGAFTYALLQGLRGAAPGDVTTASLRDYLLNNMKVFMDDDARGAATVAQEPDFAHTDEMLFVPAAQTPTFPVTLRFRDDCVGKQATIATSSAEPPAAETVLREAEWQVELAAQAYFASVPELGLVAAFTVSGGGVDGPVPVP